MFKDEPALYFPLEGAYQPEQVDIPMNFIQHDLGYRRSGDIVEITLSGNAANVRLMDSSNFYNYKNGRQHRYYGGLAKRSPVHLQIPHSGNWYVTVDMQGLGGSTRSSARILPGPLPELRETPLSSVPSLVQNDPPPGFLGFAPVDVGTA